MEKRRLDEDARREKNWKRWGPYLSERQWGTVREDDSADGSCWESFSHDQARRRAYRWGEDGLLGICDRQCRLCFSITLWNGRDPILKERLFGLTGPEGNHGEDVKECYYYLDATPTGSYMKALYKYPQAAYPYSRLVEENRRRGREAPEYELFDTQIFDDNRYFDIFAEYAKASPNDILIRITVANRGPQAARLHLLPTLWFRNTWSWGGEEAPARPRITTPSPSAFLAEHATLGRFRLEVEGSPEFLFTENETNVGQSYAKDAFHELLVEGRAEAVRREGPGTKAAAHHDLHVPAGEEVVVRLRLHSEEETPEEIFGPGFERVFEERIREANAWYAEKIPTGLTEEARGVARQAYAGMIWTKQFYHYVVREWLEGAPAKTEDRRNRDWTHLYNRDIISMPDKWEYPWYAAWDTAFHMIPFTRIDPAFAKEQLVLFLREWYMHPNGQIPAYEWSFSDVNPPVHAWAAWRVYKMTGTRGKRDRLFLSRVFQKLLLNFTWWVNRKDADGNNLFAGGFLGLDNISLFDRSKPLPSGGQLEQADGTAWMAFYCSTMLSMALELAREDPAYEDLASKFFQHFIAISDAMNNLGGSGLWDERDGFYYDKLHIEGKTVPLRVRSMVGLIPLFACELVEDEVIEGLPGFSKRMRWFLEHRRDQARDISCMEFLEETPDARRLLAIPSRERLVRVLGYVLDEEEFLSPYGIRSLSRFHKENPYVFRAGDESYRVAYVPAESDTGLFGGNSNWRGPVWFPLNFLLIEALERYHRFYGDTLRVEFPTGSGRRMNLKEVASEISSRLTRLFLPDAKGRRPAHGGEARYARDPHWKDLVLFYEYFHGDDGRGMGASHQTGWTALVTQCLEKAARAGGRSKR